MVMPSQDGSAGSWSKPTEESHPGGKNSNKKGKKKTPPSDPEGPSEPPGTDEDLDDASQRSSTAATSEIKSMLKRRMKQEDGYRPKSSLGSMKVEEFYGDRTRYLKWKRTIQAQQHLYALESNELAMLVYLSTRREARDVVEQNPIQAYTEAGRTTVVVEGVGRSLRRERCRALRTCGQGVGTLQTPAWQNNRPLPVRDETTFEPNTAELIQNHESLTWLGDNDCCSVLHSTGRERHDVYYAAGAGFQSIANEKAIEGPV